MAKFYRHSGGTSCRSPQLWRQGRSHLCRVIYRRGDDDNALRSSHVPLAGECNSKKGVRPVRRQIWPYDVVHLSTRSCGDKLCTQGVPVIQETEVIMDGSVTVVDHLGIVMLHNLAGVA